MTTPLAEVFHQGGSNELYSALVERTNYPRLCGKEVIVRRLPELKNPIAFKEGINIEDVPIKKDGIGVCERCGAIGVKHSFYTKKRNFCSLECSRLGPLKSQSPIMMSNVDEQPLVEGEPEDSAMEVTNDKVMEDDVMEGDAMEDDQYEMSKQDLSKTYEWKPIISNSSCRVASVRSFRYAPMAEYWENIVVGMKVEVENKDCGPLKSVYPDCFWIASIVRLAGYKALLRYEGIENESKKDFWVNLCSGKVHPVGWCAQKRKPLIPPKDIHRKFVDWREFLVSRLTGTRTLISDFEGYLAKSMRPKFRPGYRLEVMDKKQISQCRVAEVTEIVGRRLHLKYVDKPDDEAGFWCHERSPLIHPPGWCHRTGHAIEADEEYLTRISEGISDPRDAPESIFHTSREAHKLLHMVVKEGMMLEAVDPLNLSTICVASVQKVLKEGYLMIKIDSYESDDTGFDWFCYHIHSPYIFFCGWCEANGVELAQSRDLKDEDFDWKTHFEKTKTEPVPEYLFRVDVPEHGFKEGMHLEAVDLMEPRLVCVATIDRVVDRLMRIHFDGWKPEYDQWIDCDSPDIFPVGWCEMVGHHLEEPQPTQTITKKKLKPASMKKRKSKRGPKPKSTRAKNVYYDTKENASEVEELVPKTEESWEENGVAEEEQQQPPVEQDDTVIPQLGAMTVSQGIDPELWNVNHVAHFLEINGCGSQADAFVKKDIDGSKLLALNKDEVLDLVGGKVGPSVKVLANISELKKLLNPALHRQRNLTKHANS